MKQKIVRLVIFLFLTTCVLSTGYSSLGFAEDLETARKQYNNDVAAVTKNFESKIPREARNVDGTPMKDHPEYKKVKAQYDTAIQNVQKKYESNNLERIKQHEEAMKNVQKNNPDLAKEIKNTGSHPVNVNSDYDFSTNFDAARAYVKEMTKPGMGNTVEKKGDRFKITGKQDTTVWIDKRPGTDPVGSGSFDAEATTKANVDSDAYLSVGDNASKQIKVMDHTRKFVHAKNTGDTRVIGKTIYKASNETGIEVDPNLKNQAESLYKKGLTLQQSGIVDLGDPPEVQQKKVDKFVKDVENGLVDINKKVDADSKQEYQNLESEIDKAEKAGDKETANKLKNRKIANTIQKKATIEAITESDPELGGKLTNNEVTQTTNPDGSIVYKDKNGKIMSKSEFVRMNGTKVIQDLKSNLKSMVNPADPLVSYIKNPTSGTAGAFALLALLQAEQTLRDVEKQAQPGETEAEILAKTLVQLTGIPGTVGIGQQAANRALKEYEDCVKAGRTDCSKIMTVFKANLNAAIDASIAFGTGIADIPGFIINRPLEWGTVRPAEDAQQDMEKRLQAYLPVNVARRLAGQVSALSTEIKGILGQLDSLSTEANSLIQRAGSLDERRAQLTNDLQMIRGCCEEAKQIIAKYPGAQNSAQLATQISIRLSRVKQDSSKTCESTDQAMKLFKGGGMDVNQLENQKNTSIQPLLNRAETEYSYAIKEYETQKSLTKSTDNQQVKNLQTKANQALADFKQHISEVQSLNERSRSLTAEFNKKLSRLNTIMQQYKNTRAQFYNYVTNYYKTWRDEIPEEVRKKLVEIKMEVDRQGVDEAKAKDAFERADKFHKFATDLAMLAQQKPDSCNEVSQLASLAGSTDSLDPLFRDAERSLAAGRNCLANLKGLTTPVQLTVWIDGTKNAYVGQTVSITANTNADRNLKPLLKYVWRYKGSNTVLENRESFTKPLSYPGTYELAVVVYQVIGNKSVQLGEANHTLVVTEQQRMSVRISGQTEVVAGQEVVFTARVEPAGGKGILEDIQKAAGAASELSQTYGGGQPSGTMAPSGATAPSGFPSIPQIPNFPIPNIPIPNAPGIPTLPGQTGTPQIPSFPGVQQPYTFKWYLNNRELPSTTDRQLIQFPIEGTYNVTVIAYQKLNNQLMEVGRSTLPVVAKVKGNEKGTVFITGPNAIKAGQQATFTGNFYGANVPESSLYFNWRVDGQSMGSDKSISVYGNPPGRRTIELELWTRYQQQPIRLSMATKILVIEGQQTVQTGDQQKPQQKPQQKKPCSPCSFTQQPTNKDFTSCVKGAKTDYENTVIELNKAKEGKSEHRYFIPLGGWGAGFQRTASKQCSDPFWAKYNSSDYNQPRDDKALQVCAWEEDVKDRKTKYEKKVEECCKNCFE